MFVAVISTPFLARYRAFLILNREKGRKIKLTVAKKIKRTNAKDWGNLKKGNNIRIINDQKHVPIRKSLIKSSFITLLFLLFSISF
jgi:hypothetical protein